MCFFALQVVFILCKEVSATNESCTCGINSGMFLVHAGYQLLCGYYYESCLSICACSRVASVRHLLDLTTPGLPLL